MNVLQKRYFDLGQEIDYENVILKPSLRINTLKISEQDFVKRMSEKEVKLEKIPFLNNSYYFEAPFPLSSSEEYLLGFFYIQEAASQLPAKVLLSDFDTSLTADDELQHSVLDLCSAPGSKTTQLAQITNDQVPILALDFSAPRLTVLEYNLERLGITSVTTMRKDGKFVDDINLKFDYVLVDAPCSGNFCVDSDFFSKRSIADFKNRSQEQKQLLLAAMKVLNNGGTLVYSTCSLEPEENELVIEWLLNTFEDITLEDTGLEIGEPGLTNVFGKELNSQISKTRRLWPHKTGTEGFFIAKLKKN